MSRSARVHAVPFSGQGEARTCCGVSGELLTKMNLSLKSFLHFFGIILILKRQRMELLTPEEKQLLEDTLAQQGLRATRQREHVFAILLQQRDHPTADEVYNRAKLTMPNISLATVYNCLETLTACGLVRLVNYEREPTRYCPNLMDHAHFQDRKSGRVYDIDLPDDYLRQIKQILPAGFAADHVELHFYGRRDGASSTSHHSIES